MRPGKRIVPMADLFQSPMSAVRAHTRSLLVSAHNVANAGTKDFKPLETVMLSQPNGGVAAEVRQSTETGVDLTQETIDMISSERAIEANIAVMRASDKTLGVILDILG